MAFETYTLICSTVAGIVLAWIAGDYFIGKYRKFRRRKET
jgi:hypothetical protein